jgi:plexin A
MATLFTQLLISLFQSTGNILNFCEVGLKISGKTPIVNQAVIQFADTSLTSVTIATVERHTVAFLGTKDGRLKKVSYMQTNI